MAQVCKVCVHPKRAEIFQTVCDQAAAGALVIQTLARKYGVSRTSISNHIKTCIPASLTAAKRAGQIEQGVQTDALLQQYVQDAEKVRLACSQWMTDPDNPDCFSLERRASEVMVIYLEGVRSGQPVRRKKTLQELLAMVQAKLGIQLVDTEWFGKDPRLIYLELFGKATQLLALRARVRGEDGKKSGEDERRDWVSVVRELAQKYDKPEMEVARDLWARNESSRQVLEEQWPELASGNVM